MHFRDQSKAAIRLRIKEELYINGIKVKTGEYDGYERPNYVFFMRKYIRVGSNYSILVGGNCDKEIRVNEYFSTGIASLV